MTDGRTVASSTIREVTRHQLPLVIVFTLVAAVVALLASLAQPTEYTARTELVLGGYDLPHSVRDAVDADKSGPLGSDLRIESQAEILTSPVIAARVANGEGLGDVPTLLQSVRTKPMTDAILVVLATGPTSQLAADRADAFAREYLAYRTELGVRVLEQAAAEREAEAASYAAAAAQLTPPASPVTLLQAQRQAEAVAHDLRQAAASYTGGGQVSYPADTAAATKSPLVLRDVVFGALVGLVAGVMAAVVRVKTTSSVRTRSAAATAAQAPVLLTVPARWKLTERILRHPTQPRVVADDYAVAGQLAVAALASAMDLDGRRDARIVVRGVRSRASVGPVTQSLARGFREAGYEVDVTALDATSARDLETWATLGTARHLPSATAGRGRVELIQAAPHLSTTEHDSWPRAGASTLLVVDAVRDRVPSVQRAGDELMLAGIPVVAVGLIEADLADGSVGWPAAVSAPHGGKAPVDLPTARSPHDSEQTRSGYIGA